MQRGPRYDIDPDDPRAPSQAVWDALSPEERTRVVASLPVDVPLELYPPEGDVHNRSKQRARDALGGFFERIGRRVYVSGELGIYYPNEPRFCPDVFAVLDVERRDRTRWVVSDEGKGLDVVLEVHVEGDWKKDAEVNVARYARLGIREYFIYDRRRLRLFGYRLASADARTYQPIVPQAGRFASQVLGLDLVLEAERIRFFYGTAPLFEAEELARELEQRMRTVEQRADDEAKRADDEAKRADDVAIRLAAAEARAEAAERRLAEALAELERRGRGLGSLVRSLLIARGQRRRAVTALSHGKTEQLAAPFYDVAAKTSS